MRSSIFRALLCSFALLALAASAALAAPPAPSGTLCTDQPAAAEAAPAEDGAEALALGPLESAVPVAYNCVFYNTEHCIDTHETTPCWTIRFSEPHCPTAYGTCVTNIQYHTYDLYWCS